MQIKDIIHILEQWAPPSLQEGYDNSGLLIGDASDHAKGALITLDVTEEVIDEAVSRDCNLIIAHHPLIFKGIKRIGNRHWLDKCVRKVIKNDLHLYSIHTNLDHVITGVNYKICKKIGLRSVRILKPKSDTLLKLTVFVPTKHKKKLLEALYKVGAGEIGNYDHCSFQLLGEGTFRPNDEANPTIGKRGEDETVKETRIEVVVPKHKKHSVLSAMRLAHPYEEVAYYLSELINDNQEAGAGMIGTLEKPIDANTFLNKLKERMQLRMIRHTEIVKDKIESVAVCGGAGSFLLRDAIRQKADVFITADFKYHDFFEANGEIIVADIGHYESEVFTKELIQEKLTDFLPNFAFRLSEVDTNPVTYL